MISDKQGGVGFLNFPPITANKKRGARGEFLLLLKQQFPAFSALKIIVLSLQDKINVMPPLQTKKNAMVSSTKARANITRSVEQLIDVEEDPGQPPPHLSGVYD